MNTPAKANLFFFFKLPAAWWCGVRVKTLSETACNARVRLRWINQNPFRSMFWAVQGMAAEIATGILLISKIRSQNLNVSSLVIANEAEFTKKAVGKITFQCDEGVSVDQLIGTLKATKQPQTIWLTAVGTDAGGAVVATFKFKWSIKIRTHE
ncbi:MAG: DUF4442 domain-containing protein [Flavobacteriaceae bacterium]|nr:DUF4442 domain-containing protein [Bacteroidota bacterium]MDA1344199.1 DUF4442 domain-containing protein [Bacteroidota bacterium]